MGATCPAPAALVEAIRNPDPDCVTAALHALALEFAWRGYEGCQDAHNRLVGLTSAEVGDLMRATREECIAMLGPAP